MSSAPVAALPSDVRAKIRSGAAIVSPAHCVEELVHNALDAEADQIEILVDLGCFKIRVWDNGDGISKDDLSLVGERHHTSKCRGLEDLNRLYRGGPLGYRGEALASLREMSGYLQVASKTALDESASVVLFLKGQRKPVARYPKDFSPSSSGTVVSVLDFLYNLPVRQGLVSPALDIEDVRLSVAGLALAHPTVSFTLTDDSTKETLLQSKGAQGRTKEEVFACMFGLSSAPSFLLKAVVSAGVGGLALNGFISTEPASASGKDRQFVYVNGRMVRGSGNQLIRFVRDCLKKSVMCRPQPKESGGAGSSNPESPSRSANRNLYPAFCLDLSCPRREYDLLAEPRRTTVEFADWPTVASFVQGALSDFLRTNSLYPPDLQVELETTPQASSPVQLNFSPNVTGILPLPLGSPDIGSSAKSFSGNSRDSLEDELDLGCQVLEDVMDTAEDDIVEHGEDRERIGRLLSDFLCDVDGARTSREVKGKKKPQLQDAASASLNAEKVVEECVGKEVLPDGWVRKEAEGGRTYFVQLSSGTTFKDLPRHPPLKRKTISGGKQTSKNEALSTLLPEGKTPFLQGKKSRLTMPRRDGALTGYVHSKWRNPTDAAIASSSTSGLKRTGAEILASWKNPNFFSEVEVSNLSKKTVSGFSFHRCMFDDLTLVGQVDRKFIAAKVRDDGKDTLVLFDQHAVHERIRLEDLLEEHYQGQKELVSAPVDSPLVFGGMSSFEINVLQNYTAAVRRFGLDFKVTGKESGEVTVFRVPVCFLQREASEVKYRRPSPLAALLRSALTDLVRDLRDGRGVASRLPSTVHDVLASQACRSAIKFGDGLSLGACKRLLERLARCALPFQCAHGRPSVTPVAALSPMGVPEPKPTSSIMSNLHSLIAAEDKEEEEVEVGCDKG